MKTTKIEEFLKDSERFKEEIPRKMKVDFIYIGEYEEFCEELRTLLEEVRKQEIVNAKNN